MGDADAGDDAKSEAALEECVRLLSSDSREKKFVGMLLVRSRPRRRRRRDADARVRSDRSARFVTSMLRAAPAPRATAPATAEEAEARAAQATASHALALATCAALSKSPDVATDDPMVERLPSPPPMARKGRYAGASPAPRWRTWGRGGDAGRRRGRRAHARRRGRGRGAAAPPPPSSTPRAARAPTGRRPRRRRRRSAPCSARRACWRCSWSRPRRTTTCTAPCTAQKMWTRTRRGLRRRRRRGRRRGSADGRAFARARARADEKKKPEPNGNRKRARRPRGGAFPGVRVRLAAGPAGTDRGAAVFVAGALRAARAQAAGEAHRRARQGGGGRDAGAKNNKKPSDWLDYVRGGASVLGAKARASSSTSR